LSKSSWSIDDENEGSKTIDGNGRNQFLDAEIAKDMARGYFIWGLESSWFTEEELEAFPPCGTHKKKDQCISSGWCEWNQGLLTGVCEFSHKALEALLQEIRSNTIQNEDVPIVYILVMLSKQLPDIDTVAFNPRGIIYRDGDPTPTLKKNYSDTMASKLKGEFSNLFYPNLMEFQGKQNTDKYDVVPYWAQVLHNHLITTWERYIEGQIRKRDVFAVIYLIGSIVYKGYSESFLKKYARNSNVPPLFEKIDTFLIDAISVKCPLQDKVAVADIILKYIEDIVAPTRSSQSLFSSLFKPSWKSFIQYDELKSRRDEAKGLPWGAIILLSATWLTNWFALQYRDRYYWNIGIGISQGIASGMPIPQHWLPTPGTDMHSVVTSLPFVGVKTRVFGPEVKSSRSLYPRIDEPLEKGNMTMMEVERGMPDGNSQMCYAARGWHNRNGIVNAKLQEVYYDRSGFKEPVDVLIDDLKGLGVKSTYTTMMKKDIDSLYSKHGAHSKTFSCGGKTAIHPAWMPIMITSDGYVIDSHSGTISTKDMYSKVSVLKIQASKDQLIRWMHGLRTAPNKSSEESVVNYVTQIWNRSKELTSRWKL
jgi:hypothetical protein